MTIASPDVLQKSDIGGVEVGIHSEDVRDTYRALRDRAASHDPDATILGVRVEELDVNPLVVGPDGVCPLICG
ncbi:acetyltransferase [Halopenitus persicus]|uniref:Acetyltransferase n=1 Tax=Halopenitus persicus TaxID=1048396 RepID=A0A1H3JVA3_9EURY|nr:acetyltransferase [Halopenitus persicus]